MKSGRTAWWPGIRATVSGSDALARALAVMDSRAVVRAFFLASAVDLDLFGQLGSERSLDDLARSTGSSRTDRLAAWLQVGVEVGELSRRGEWYRIRGRRSRAIAGGDRVLRSHYLTVLGYQHGCYADLRTLLADRDGGRADLERSAREIAEVSLAAAPFVSAFLEQTVRARPGPRVLDVGCGTGVYSKVVLDADRAAVVEGVDLSADVVEEAQSALRRAGLAHRADLHVGDVRQLAAGADHRFDLVLLVNNIYYFDPTERAGLFGSLARLLRPGGELVVVSMEAQGSIAAAHLQFMLTCQAAKASLPTSPQLRSDLSQAGLEVRQWDRLVPTEPFVGVRAGRRR